MDGVLKLYRLGNVISFADDSKMMNKTFIENNLKSRVEQEFIKVNRWLEYNQISQYARILPDLGPLKIASDIKILMGKWYQKSSNIFELTER